MVFTLTSPLFHFSCFGPKSRGVSFLLGRTVPREFILSRSKISEILRDEKEIHRHHDRQRNVRQSAARSGLSAHVLLAEQVGLFH